MDVAAASVAPPRGFGGSREDLAESDGDSGSGKEARPEVVQWRKTRPCASVVRCLSLSAQCNTLCASLRPSLCRKSVV